MIINNSISADSYSERAERLQLLSTNIDTFAVDLGIIDPRLTSCRNADGEWDDACAKCVVEDGQKDEAYEEFNKAILAASKYYSALKKHLLTIIYEFGGKPDDFINQYGFNVDSPRKYKPLTAAIEAWKREHDRLVAIPDPRVVSGAMMTNLWAHKTGIDYLSNAAYIEKNEADTAFDEKQALFDVHTNLLQFVLTAAILTWGDEDPRLNLLGFKPKSEIWTPGQPGSGWDSAPIAKMIKAFDPLDGILAGCEDYEGTERFDLRIAWAKKNDPAPDMPDTDTYTDIMQPALLDADGFPLQKNFVYYLWIRARKDGEVSEWSEVASFEWTE